MNSIQRLKDIIEPTVKIEYIKPINLEKLSKEFKESGKFPDIKSSFEFPPKSIDLVIELVFKKEYKKLNFFDIARLLQQLEQDLLSLKIKDKFLFTQLLQELFNNSERYIQNLIIKIITKIYNDNNHSFKDDLLVNMKSKEFLFIKLCIKKDFKTIHKSIKNQDFKRVLKYFTVNKILLNLIVEYQDYLLHLLSKTILTDDTIVCYVNNLLNEDSLDNLYHQLKVIITLIEKKQNPKNNNLLDLIISDNLEDIENTNAKWNQLGIPDDLKERYKRLKGVFEFQRFVDIAEYLNKHSDLSQSNVNPYTNDAKRILTRSKFWSNYDSRFASVQMWVSRDDYILLNDSSVDLSKINQLHNIDNEMCIFNFKDTELVIIITFRQAKKHHNFKDRSTNKNRFESLIFENNNAIMANNLINNCKLFDMEINEQLHKYSNSIIKFDKYWQGWIDEFLRNKNIYPNESILNGKKFIGSIEKYYKKEIGLQETRNDALNDERAIRYENIIIKGK